MAAILYISPILRLAAAEPHGAFLTLRTAPDSRAPAAGQVPDGTRLLVFRERNGWCEVCARGCHGWVSKTDILLFF